MKDSLTVSRSGENLSVNASHCHLPYRGEALAFRKASPFRQRLPSVGELSPKVTERAPP